MNCPLFLIAAMRQSCISFGGMVNRKAERIDQIVREASKQMNNRGIILSGLGSVKNRSSKDLLYLESAPHDWLLPRCKMVIHHGGAGTTSAGYVRVFQILLCHSLLINSFGKSHQCNWCWAETDSGR